MGARTYICVITGLEWFIINMLNTHCLFKISNVMLYKIGVLYNLTIFYNIMIFVQDYGFCTRS